jgi:hypothetical protein
LGSLRFDVSRSARVYCEARLHPESDGTRLSSCRRNARPDIHLYVPRIFIRRRNPGCAGLSTTGAPKIFNPTVAGHPLNTRRSPETFLMSLRRHSVELMRTKRDRSDGSYDGFVGRAVSAIIDAQIKTGVLRFDTGQYQRPAATRAGRSKVVDKRKITGDGSLSIHQIDERRLPNCSGPSLLVCRLYRNQVLPIRHRVVGLDRAHHSWRHQ